MKSLRKIKSPAALATLGAFCVPEPFGACLVLAAAVWWSYRKWYGAWAPALRSHGKQFARWAHSRAPRRAGRQLVGGIPTARSPASACD